MSWYELRGSTGVAFLNLALGVCHGVELPFCGLEWSRPDVILGIDRFMSFSWKETSYFRVLGS